MAKSQFDTDIRPGGSAVAGTSHSVGTHKGLALLIIAAAQLMIVLDATIVNIALPHIQDSLHFTNTGLSWVLSAYTLTFGGLLLLGARSGDILGRRRMFVIGILIFALASLLGGLATTSGLLLAARALQGVGGAIASPTSLALITTNFAEGEERNRAFGVFAAVSGAGAALGLILGGVLTELLNWRWTLFVNVPIGILLAWAAIKVLRESARHPGTFDFSGALTSTIGMVALVYGFIRASEHGWSNSLVWLSFAVAGLMLAAFVLIERRHNQPITPLRMFANRDRTGSYLVMLIFAAAMFGMFFFLTQFVQKVMGYSPIKAGFAFLPVTVAIGITAQLASKLLPKAGPRLLMLAGGLLASAGLFWLTRLHIGSGYVTGLLLPMVLFGLGMGFIFVPVTIVALTKVPRTEAGAASGLLNAMQQVGGSVGLAVLVNTFGTAMRHNAGRYSPPEALAHSIASSFRMAALFAAIAFLLTLILIHAKASDLERETIVGV
jgi:EmrB/QacA subfamily drug resistance transporter